ncbi:MAG TPA: hypothetical protein VK763_12760 [Terriglobales bacterium]|jgi:hypothetical protein|nr:hypothetical protein [Terriglobales bacterium]
MRNTRISAGFLFFFLGVALVLRAAESPGPTAGTATVPVLPATVIGFVGGFVKPDAHVHSTVQLAERLRNLYPAGVYIKVFENHHGDQAYRELLRHLDSDNDGKLSPEEKRQARIIIFGHSWGASETVTLARKLEKDEIPVLLTIQVDSVSKGGENDALIPANVSQAVNYYQPHGLVHGRPKIRAADPEQTEIVGNFRYDYSEKPISCDGYPWFNRFLIRPHTEIECDPKVWNQIETLIQSKLSPAVQASVIAGPTRAH